MLNFRIVIAVALVFILIAPAQSQIGFGPLYEKETIKLKSKKLSNFKILYHNGKAVVLNHERRSGIRISSTNAFKENLGYANALVKIASSDESSSEMFDALSTFENERALSSIKRSRVSNQQKEFKKREALAEIQKKGDLEQLKRVGENIKGNLAYATYKFFPDYDFDRGVFVFSVSAGNRNCSYTFAVPYERAEKLISRSNIYFEIRESTTQGYKYYLYPNTTSGDPFVVFTTEVCK